MIESINSQLFEATNRMSPKNGPHKIQVFTESFEDIAFWRAILDDFTTSRYQFEITTSSRNTNVRGKHEVLNRVSIVTMIIYYNIRILFPLQSINHLIYFKHTYIL